MYELERLAQDIPFKVLNQLRDSVRVGTGLPSANTTRIAFRPAETYAALGCRFEPFMFWSSLLLGEGSVVYFALYDWFDVDDRGALDGFE